MKNRTMVIAFGALFISLGFSKHDSNVHFQIRKDNPALGITLAWSLPENQLQKIVGNQFKPVIKNGKGFLMLFIATAKQYYLDSTAHDNLKLAHIIIPVKGEQTINAPLSIVPEKQKINELLKQYNFKMEIGEIGLNVNYKNDSILIEAQIITPKGTIELSSTFLNKPKELKLIESTKVFATDDSNSFFIGPESYKPVEIKSIEIKSIGKNWISQLNLPLKPDRIWLNVDFSWDFIFTKTKNYNKK